MSIFFRTEGETRSFWEVEREDCTVTTRWGELGGRGEEEVRELADEENAAAYVEQLVAERRAEGFVPLDETAPRALGERAANRTTPSGTTAGSGSSAPRPRGSASGR